MLTFGFDTLIDLLSWAAVIALAVKILATLFVLTVDKDMRDRPGWGSGLWWATKVTPIVAVPGVIWIAVLQHETGTAWLYGAAGLFVMVAVPLKIQQRRRRIAKRSVVGTVLKR